MISFEKISGYRLIIFSWDNPLIEGYYLNFLNEIAKYIKIFPVAIVTSFLSKLRLIRDGIHAFSYQELINWSLESYKDARDIRRSFSKAVLEDLSDYDNKLGWKWIPQENYFKKEFYVHQSSVILNAYDFLWRHLHPHLAITWNGVALFQKALSLLARTYDVPVLFLERGLLPDTLYVDSEGVNYKSSIAGEKWFQTDIPNPKKNDIAKIRKYCQQLRETNKSVVDVGESNTIKELRKRMNIDDTCKIVLFPLQIENDSNILYFSPYYSNMLEIIKDIQQATAQRNDIHLIVKPHPEDRNRLNELRSLNNNKTHILHDANLYSILELADLVITVNSTVGLEALLFQKPVVVLGKAIYSEKGFTYDLLHQNELTKIIEQAFKKNIFNKKEFYKFLLHILEHKLFSLNHNQDIWQSRPKIANQVVNLINNNKKNNGYIDEIIIKKILNNIIIHKIFDKKNIIALGMIDGEIESLLLKSSKQIKKVTSLNEAIRSILSSILSRNKLDLLIAKRPLSFKRLIAFKLINAKQKILLTNNEIYFLRDTTKDKTIV